MSLDSIECESLGRIRPPGLCQQNGVLRWHIATLRADALFADEVLVEVGSHVVVWLFLGKNFVGNDAPRIYIAFQTVGSIETDLRRHVSDGTDGSGHIEHDVLCSRGIGIFLFLDVVNGRIGCVQTSTGG